MKKVLIILITVIAIGTLCSLYYIQKTSPSNEGDAIDIDKSVIDPSEHHEVNVDLEPFEKAKNISVEKVVRTTTEGKDGSYKTVYDTYVVSNIDLVNGTDCTEDMAEALADTEYNEEKIRAVRFEDAIGFSYKGINARIIHDRLLEAEGFNGDLSSASIDEDVLNSTGEKNYIVGDKCMVTDKLLPGDDSVDVIEEKVYYKTTEEADEKIIPDYYVAMLRYKQNDTTVERSIYLQITINDMEAM